MKIGKIIRTAIKWAPVVYPVVKKVLASNKKKTTVPYRKK